MSPPVRKAVKTSFFNMAGADESPNTVAMPVKAVMMAPASVQNAAQTIAPLEHLAPITRDTTATVAAPSPLVPQMTVGVLPIWGWGILWVLAVIAGSEGLKRVMKAFGIKDRLSRKSWRRWLHVVPLGAASVLSAIWGHELTNVLFGVHVDIWFSLFLVAPISAFMSGYTYDLGRYVGRDIVVPLLPEVVIGLINKIPGVDIDEEAAKSAIDSGKFPAPPSEVLDIFAADSSDVIDDEPDTVPMGPE